MRTAGRIAVAIGVLLAAAMATARTGADPVTWREYKHVPNVVDVVGPRGDGRLVVAAGGHLHLLRPSTGRLTSYPSVGRRYATNPKLEPYIALAGPRQRVAAAGCTFPRGTVYAIEPAGKTGVFAISPRGRTRRLARITAAKTLNGIVFDTGGRFGGRLLVIGLSGDDHGVLMTVDCRGRVRVLTREAPHLEGGLAVAPPGFGDAAGARIAPDELDGRLIVLTPDGGFRDLVAVGQPAGGDIGVESVGFAPSPLRSAYLADRFSPGNRNPGHDEILRLTADELQAAGVEPGDLLASLEGGGNTIAVRCRPTCQVFEVAAAPAQAHSEGHITFAGG
jgi:hypothetical protein